MKIVIGIAKGILVVIILLTFLNTCATNGILTSACTQGVPV